MSRVHIAALVNVTYITMLYAVKTFITAHVVANTIDIKVLRFRRKKTKRCADLTKAADASVLAI